MPIIEPCLDSAEMAEARRRELSIPVAKAAELGRSAVTIATQGWYLHRPGQKVDISHEVQAACAGKRSIAPGAALGNDEPQRYIPNYIQVANETTLGAARRLVEDGLRRPVVLNFANGLHPGGGFLDGARAQEEVLCRSSALYLTLKDDPMYAAHLLAGSPASSDWVIYSPDVPVFRTDDGALLPQAWPLSVITCAAPYAPAVGAEKSAALLRQRIHRVLEVAQAMGHTSIVLGAWGCGAFRNDARRTALDFREALEGPFNRTFTQVVFAISDWSPERRTLGAFREAFPDPEPEPARTIPVKADDWQIKPMPARHVDIPVERRFSDAEMAQVRLGVLPDRMEDKWFVYWDDGRLYLHRSWTGMCVFVAQFVEDAEGWRLVSIRANRDRKQYTQTDDAEDAAMARFVIDVVVLGLFVEFPDEDLAPPEAAIAAWGLVGRAFLGQHPK
jgi:uncharacterized protein (TIGR02452 family)